MAAAWRNIVALRQYVGGVPALKHRHAYVPQQHVNHAAETMPLRNLARCRDIVVNPVALKSLLVTLIV
jgi:hypothetical protein